MCLLSLHAFFSPGVQLSRRGFSGIAKDISEQKIKKKHIKRGGLKSKSRYKKESLIIFGNNVNGIVGKTESVKNLLNVLMPAIMMIQETKVYKP